MNLKTTQQIQVDAVYQKLMAHYEASPEAVKELQEALAVIARWEEQARIALVVDEKMADFTVYSFEITQNEVKIFVEQGANG